MLITSLLFMHLTYSINIKDIYHTNIDNYYIHENQLSTILAIPNARKISITQLQEQSICNAKQRTLGFHTKLYQQFEEIEYLVALVQLTPSSYLLYSSNNTLIFKDSNTTQHHQFQMDINEQISMIKLDSDVLLVSNNEAFLFELESLASGSAIYREVKDWQKRVYRRLTKLIKIVDKQFLLSAIGKDGLELYSVEGRNIIFIKQIQAYKDIVDFAEVNNNVFILDSEQGLILCNVEPTNLTTQIMKIDNMQGGIAVDSYNGINVFVAYKWVRYAVVEYVINQTSKLWYKHNMIYTKKIYDVDALADFAIIQGQYHHIVLFNYHLSDEITYFKHYHLSDFQVFYHQDSVYFSGITSKSYVFSELYVLPAQITCFSNQTKSRFYYTLSYIQQTTKSKYERHYQQISVNVVETYFYQDSLFIIIIGSSLIMILFILLLVILIKRNKSMQITFLELENTISTKLKQDILKKEEDPPQIIQSNLMSVRECKDIEHLNIQQ
ncbi:unnamed protein product [Paramecium sonneborni]|uniref:Transmembrane protein n=1 Tax=Paramecium sonneborni TaxID=65129 RepID=A0A8S1RKG0_9CILI|nr:unnamed protein product [Paramecium sonneborni]